MRLLRVALLLAGLTLAAVGGWYLLQSGLADLVRVGWWLAAGILLHDAVLAPLTIVVAFLGVRLVPGWLRAPLSAGALVLGSVTLLAIPVLGRYGDRPDNPTLLDRDYTSGWLLLAAIIALAVCVAAAFRRLTGVVSTRETGQADHRRAPAQYIGIPDEGVRARRALGDGATMESGGADRQRSRPE